MEFLVPLWEFYIATLWDFYITIHNVEAGSYEELKKEPDKYKLYESENYITFILKNREKNSKALKSFIVFRVHTTLEEVTLKSFSIYGPELEFMNKAAKEEVWE